MDDIWWLWLCFNKRKEKVLVVLTTCVRKDLLRQDICIHDFWKLFVHIYTFDKVYLLPNIFSLDISSTMLIQFRFFISKKGWMAHFILERCKSYQCFSDQYDVLVRKWKLIPISRSVYIDASFIVIQNRSHNT